MGKSISNEKYALISVFDKSGVADFANILRKLGFKIISTGGTAKTLTEAGIKVIPIQEITQSPESFDGRMKTIGFQIEGGILFDRQNPSHVKQARDLGIKPIDVVVCNLYPFEQTIQNPKVTLNEAIENIDVGGPTMVRAGAKNFKNVLVVVDPKDYERVGEALKSNCHPKRSEGSGFFANAQNDMRRKLAAKAFAHLSLYDSQIARFLNNSELFPDELTLPGRKVTDLRYGENPHQKAAFYSYPTTNSPMKNLQKLWGRDLSLINLTDINAGLESVRLFDPKEGTAAVIIKHNNPCGLALGKTAEEALKRAIAVDPESAFGGVVVLNNPIDLKTAKVIGAFKNKQKANIDIVAVPGIEEAALEYLKQVRKSMGIYTFGNIPKQRGHDENIKWIEGGFIIQTADDNVEKVFKEWKVVTRLRPTKKQLKQMRIAWKFVTRIRSNSVIVVDKTLPMTRGIGSGQTSRFRSTQIALKQANSFAKGGILASDSFFPFDDSVKLAAKSGISAIIQQGGSINDQASIDAANKAGISMVFTFRRAFWH